jgi:uncharacterized membrane protein YjfL (UPF0719 family)
MSKILTIIFGFILSFGLIVLEQTQIIKQGSPLFSFVSVISYSILGSILLFSSYKILDWIMPADVEKEIFENQNVAAAIFKGLILLGVAIIIAAVIVSP